MADLAARSSALPLEVWTGIECTVNRVGDAYFDQIERSGHHRRDDDLDRLADLGVRTVRYPILWERTAPGALDDADWTWPDARLARLRTLGIAPIVGLVHHGSGPRGTSLTDPGFPDRLARYAARVAERYPWIRQFTPINEPLTTARFSGLYGHWYPHGRDDLTFARCLVVQCKAIVLAMQAICAVTPRAQLVFTEDLGATRSTPRLAYQARFENLRRWLSLDLVCGRVDRHHPMRRWLCACGLPEPELDWFLDHPYPPDLIGCNYYVTSERYLDDQLVMWPANHHGGNGRDRYADIDAVRACGLTGIEALLQDVHARFALPVAITEAHLGCTREQQLRWLLHIYDAASRARDQGVPVCAVTAWAAFGSYDWHCLVTREDGIYEPGLFDVRGPAPRPTALAWVVRDLAAGRRPRHPAITGPGWWQDRFAPKAA
ncbi:MAG TPA: family 1 glycosylhydrolase [Kofleriaceae bacterium]|jgi:dTDP-4-dehydrorhamnose reductase|nr:family 1 glycosylhydrolase [Kofleriaceae bacterium]